MVINKSNIVSFVFFVVSAVLLLSTFYVNEPLKLYNSHKKSPQPPKPRFIFVDLGANRADSLEIFLGHEGAKFKYDFPRPDWATYDQAGAYCSHAFPENSPETLPSLNLTLSTDIYLFEANPHFNIPLVEAKERYRDQGINVNIFPSTVVDVKDGTRTFYLDTVNEGNDFWGSSTYAVHPDVVNSHSNGTELTSINISRWLLMNTLPRDYVVVKMDIEGAEYQVIPHMLEMSAWKVVDYLFVEWHSWVLSGDSSTGQMVKIAQEELVAKGVNMPAYDSPA